MNVFAESKELNSIDFISKFNFKKLTCVSIVRVKLINNLNEQSEVYFRVYDYATFLYILLNFLGFTTNS